MFILTDEKKALLERMHGEAKERRHADRIKAVLLTAEGWHPSQIAQALRLTEETVRKHIQAYVRSEKLTNAYKGTEPKLSKDQETALIEHLESQLYRTMEEIRDHVRKTYGVSYSHQGMNNWLHRHGFSYKKPKGIPAKADPVKQAEFIEIYQKLKATIPADEPILFGDSVHPTQSTQMTEGWIRCGKNFVIPTTGSRTRLNITGALNLETMEVISAEHETIDSSAIIRQLEGIRERYSKAPKIHLFQDCAGYHKTQEVQDRARELGIIMYYLPPYSPNLNPIERVWKVLNEQVRNNVYFKSKAEFIDAIRKFFRIIWPRIRLSLIDRINDNFETLAPLT